MTSPEVQIWKATVLALLEETGLRVGQDFFAFLRERPETRLELSFPLPANLDAKRCATHALTHAGVRVLGLDSSALLFVLYGDSPTITLRGIDLD